MEGFCKRNGLNIKRHSYLGRHILVNSISNTAFCFAPKVGCTNLKILFFIAQGNTSYCISAITIYYAKVKLIMLANWIKESPHLVVISMCQCMGVKNLMNCGSSYHPLSRQCKSRGCLRKFL